MPDITPESYKDAVLRWISDALDRAVVNDSQGLGGMESFAGTPVGILLIHHQHSDAIVEWARKAVGQVYFEGEPIEAGHTAVRLAEEAKPNPNLN